jgi:hypothetical protein
MNVCVQTLVGYYFIGQVSRVLSCSEEEDG